jgi:hypothetical protein
VLHFSASALSEPASSVRKHFTVGGGLLKFTSNVPNDGENINERWGEFVAPGKTVVRLLRYRVEGVEVRSWIPK